MRFIDTQDIPCSIHIWLPPALQLLEPPVRLQGRPGSTNHWCLKWIWGRGFLNFPHPNSGINMLLAAHAMSQSQREGWLGGQQKHRSRILGVWRSPSRMASSVKLKRMSPTQISIHLTCEDCGLHQRISEAKGNNRNLRVTASEIRTWANSLVLVSYRQHLRLVGMMYKDYTVQQILHVISSILPTSTPMGDLSGSRPQVLCVIIFLASSILIEVLDFMHVFVFACCKTNGLNSKCPKRDKIWVWQDHVGSASGTPSLKAVQTRTPMKGTTVLDLTVTADQNTTSINRGASAGCFRPLHWTIW